MVKWSKSDKAKPSVRARRKATGLAEDGRAAGGYTFGERGLSIFVCHQRWRGIAYGTCK